MLLPWPSRSAWPRWAMIPYLVLADLQNTALAAFLTFYDRVLYPTYEHAPRLWGSNPLDDQVIAGTIMWVPGSIIFLVPAAIDCHSISLAEIQIPRAESHSARPVRSHRERIHSTPAKNRFGSSSSLTSHLIYSRFPILGEILRSKSFRRGMQVIMLIAAIAIVLDGFLGPQAGPMNLAGVLPWTHWRGFTVIALLLVGNLFCMVCPFTFVRDFARRWLPAKWVWPRSLRNKWLAVFLSPSISGHTKRSAYGTVHG